MLKADRDKIMNRLSPENRSNFRRILQEIRKERETLPGQRVTAREVLQSLGEDLRADVRGLRSGFGAKQQDADDLPGVFVGDYNASHLLWSFGLDIRF